MLLKGENTNSFFSQFRFSGDCVCLHERIDYGKTDVSIVGEDQDPKWHHHTAVI